MSSTARLAALAALSATLHSVLLPLSYLLRGDLTSPIAVIPPSVVAFLALGLAVGVGFLGARRLAPPDGTPFGTRLAAAGGGAVLGAAVGHVVGLFVWPVVVLGVGPSLFAGTGSLVVLGTTLAVLESAVLATVACLAGAVLPGALAPDGRLLAGPLAALALVAGLVAGVAVAAPASSTLAPTTLPWWVYGALSAVVVPLSVLAVSRRRSAAPALAPAGLAVLVASALLGHILGFGVVTLASLLARPSAPISFHLPPFGLLWVDLVVGAAVVGLATFAGLSPDVRDSDRVRSTTDHAVDD